MKKFIIVILISFSTNSVFAYSCSALLGKLDYEINLAKESGVSSLKIDKILKLRDKGFKAHDEGNHDLSEQLLKKGLKLINDL
tara:strand:+ start:324 stop:572 length:249 start_codon:yes stop_codon:yes gene_type:complete